MGELVLWIWLVVWALLALIINPAYVMYKSKVERDNPYSEYTWPAMNYLQIVLGIMLGFLWPAALAIWLLMKFWDILADLIIFWYNERKERNHE